MTVTRFQRSFFLIILAQAFCLIVGLWINNRLINALSSDEFLAAQGTSVKRTANPASDLSTAFAYTNGVEISEKQISTSKLNTSTSIFSANGFTFIWVIAIQAVLVYFVLNRVKTELDTENQKNYHESLAKTRDLSQTRDAIIFGLAQLAESRDRDTGQHLERIALYSTRLASAVRHDPRFQKHVSPSFVRLIGISSALHDIGKVSVSDSVLLKPGPLTDEERSEMQMHAKRGAECIQNIETQLGQCNFLQMAKEIASSHHEKWDGTGYPSGLRGKQYLYRQESLPSLTSMMRSVHVEPTRTRSSMKQQSRLSKQDQAANSIRL